MTLVYGSSAFPYPLARGGTRHGQVEVYQLTPGPEVIVYLQGLREHRDHEVLFAINQLYRMVLFRLLTPQDRAHWFVNRGDAGKSPWLASRAGTCRPGCKTP